MPAALALFFALPARGVSAPGGEVPVVQLPPPTTVDLSFARGLAIRGDLLTVNAHLLLYGTAQVTTGDAKGEGVNILYARPAISGIALSERLTYVIQAELAGTPRLLDAQVTYELFPLLRLTVGQFVTPFTRQFLIPQFRILFTDFAPSTLFFRGNRDRGAMLGGRDHGFEWNVGFFDGSGITSNVNDNAKGAFYGRLAYDIIGSSIYDEVPQLLHGKPFLSIGASGAYNDVELFAATAGNAPSPAGHVARRTAGADLFAGYGLVTLQAEAYYQVTRDTIGGPRVRRYGGYGQLGVFVLPDVIELGVRGDQVKLDDIAGPTTKQLAGIVAVYLYGHHLKLQARYAYQDADGANPLLPTGRTHDAQLGMQLWF